MILKHSWLRAYSDMDGAFTEIPLEDYIRVLSDRRIDPGGGSASALVASLAAGLNLMVINFTYKPGIAADLLRELDSLKKEQTKLRDRLIRLVDKDCEVFTALMKSLSEKKDSREKFRDAANIPFEVCELCAGTMEITRRIFEIGNKNLVCDIGCACNFLISAFDSARLNVEINLKYIKNSKLVKNMNMQIKRLSHQMAAAHEDISGKVTGSIRG
jgi:formiminotetrahydrofolate cyclodeaminase